LEDSHAFLPSSKFAPAPLSRSDRRTGSIYLLHREKKDNERGMEGGHGGLGKKELKPNKTTTKKASVSYTVIPLRWE
jgi:hypothetical protein